MPLIPTPLSPSLPLSLVTLIAIVVIVLWHFLHCSLVIDIMVQWDCFALHYNLRVYEWDYAHSLS